MKLFVMRLTRGTGLSTAVCLFKVCQEKQLKSTSAVGTGIGTQKSAFTWPNLGGSVGPGARKMTADFQPLPRLADTPRLAFIHGRNAGRKAHSKCLPLFLTNINLSSTNQTRRRELCGEVTPPRVGCEHDATSATVSTDAG